MTVIDKEKLARNIDKLEISEWDRKIVKFHYGLTDHPHTLEATGRAFGITRERVRQIIEKVKTLLTN